MIDYEQEYYNFLLAHPFTQLPSKEVIKTNERIALIVWANYQPKERDDDDRDYIIALGVNYDLVSELYLPYANNVDFWKKVFTQKNKVGNDVFALLENEAFLLHNAPAVKVLKEDKEFFIDLYKTFKDDRLLKFLDLTEAEMAPFVKEKILSSRYGVNYKEVEKYLDDKDFLLELFNQGYNRSIYSQLPEHLQRDKDIIFKAIRKNDWSLFLEMPKDLQIKYFEKTQDWNKSNFDLKTMQRFTIEQQKELLLSNGQIFRELINRLPSIYLPIATEMVVKDINHINLLDKQSLSQVISNPLLKSQIQTQIDDFVANYRNIEVNDKQQHIINLIKQDEILFNQLKHNIYYQISQIPKGKLPQEKFFEMVDKVYDDYSDNIITDIQAEIYLQKTRNKLTIESLKELRLPGKALFEMFKVQKLKEHLDEKLQINQKARLKKKI